MAILLQQAVKQFECNIVHQPQTVPKRTDQ
uniref:Uncharacterized protein n=1 Tax=Aegilops tauschii subsp. strangulata TaxID=200361 RepID=A0A453P107_AEGTS